MGGSYFYCILIIWKLVVCVQVATSHWSKYWIKWDTLVFPTELVASHEIEMWKLLCAFHHRQRKKKSIFDLRVVSSHASPFTSKPSVLDHHILSAWLSLKIDWLIPRQQNIITKDTWNNSIIFNIREVLINRRHISLGKTYNCISKISNIQNHI